MTRDQLINTAFRVPGVLQVYLEEVSPPERRWYHSIPWIGRRWWDRACSRSGVWIHVVPEFKYLHDVSLFERVAAALEDYRPFGMPYHVVSEWPRWLEEERHRRFF